MTPGSQYIATFRKKRRAEALKMLGGKCANCNTVDDLQFDHIDPETKVGEVMRLLQRERAFFLAEVQKCQLLCYRCHLKKTIANGDSSRKNYRVPKHGTPGAFVWHKCRCKVCVIAHRKYRQIHG